MKITIKLFLLLIAFLLITDSCTAQREKQTSGKTQNLTSSYPEQKGFDHQSYTTSYIRDFDEIVVQVPLDIEIIESGETYIRWNGGDVIFTQEGNKLIITGRKGADKSGKVYIGNSNLSKIWLNGSGNTNITNHKTKGMKVVLNGSGDATINTAENQSINLLINSSGNVKLIGNLKQGKFTVNGSGEIDATKVKAEKVNCLVSGSGTIKIYAAKYVDGHILGSGRIKHPNLTIDQKNLIITSGSFKAKIN